jgi:DNA-binding NtrC family response regulator
MARKILIVDDDADLRQILAAALAPLGETSTASDGADALRQLRQTPARLMLLDVAMPGMGGLEALSAALAAQPNLIVVMLTAEADIAVAERALSAGARTYITKPFEQDEVVGEVRRLLAEAPGGGASPTEYRPWRVVT